MTHKMFENTGRIFTSNNNFVWQNVKFLDIDIRYNSRTSYIGYNNTAITVKKDTLKLTNK